MSTAAPAAGGDILHASAVEIAGRALLILGGAGAGKSALALRLVAFGARLISDDRTGLCETDAGLAAFCPADPIRGLIEARGIGILRITAADLAQGPVPLALVVDLDRVETERLPPRRNIDLNGYELPLVLRPQNDHLAEGLLAWMKGGRQE